MITVFVRFYAELNDVLPAERRQVEFDVQTGEHTSVKHLIEALGAPHTEVDMILINGAAVPFTARLHEGDRISVYPVFESFDIAPAARLRPQPLRDPRFVLDGHLGRLAAYLRMAGFDCLYSNNADDADLAEVSAREERILLTRDRGLLKRSCVTRGYLVRENLPAGQLQEVSARFELAGLFRPFTRCARCNTLLESVELEAVLDRLPERARCAYTRFSRCPGCGQVYWHGSHVRRMQALFDRIQPFQSPAKESQEMLE